MTQATTSDEPVTPCSQAEQIAALTAAVAQLTQERDHLAQMLSGMRRAGGRWVRVEDEWPILASEDAGGWFSSAVLVCDEDNPSSLGVGHMRDSGEWVLYGSDGDYLRPTTVTHWMPVPDSPLQHAQLDDPRAERRALVDAGSLEAAIALYRRATDEAMCRTSAEADDFDASGRAMRRWQTALLQALRLLVKLPK